MKNNLYFFSTRSGGYFHVLKLKTRLKIELKIFNGLNVDFWA